MTYKELYEYGCLELKAAEICEYKLDARLLFEYVLDTSYSDLLVNPDKKVLSGDEEKYKELIYKRATHIPLQHLTGTQNFMGLDFTVSKDVLIPRQDTETLVEEVLKDLHDGMRILDMCTGSGCILLSLLHYSNDTLGVGADISEGALHVAKKNADDLGLSDRVSFINSDLFENVEGKFDILVSNPPYIRTEEISTLMPEVKDHDPFIALDGHESGLYFYEKIIEAAPSFLKKGSHVAFEIGNDQGEAVSKLMIDAGYKEVAVINDLCGNARVVKGYYYV